MRRTKNCMKCGGMPKYQEGSRVPIAQNVGTNLLPITTAPVTMDALMATLQNRTPSMAIRPDLLNTSEFNPDPMLLAGLGLQGTTTGLSEISGRIERERQNRYLQEQMAQLGQTNPIPFETLMNSQPNAYSLYARYGGSLKRYKKGGINIKPENKGKFTEYCGGNVTEECIERGKNSPNPLTRKRATFADNARHWNKQTGGEMIMGSTTVRPTRGAENPNQYYRNSPLMFRDNPVNMADFINTTIGDRLNPMDTEDARVLSSQGLDDNTRALIDYLSIFNQRTDMINANPQQRLESFYSLPSRDPRIQEQIDRIRTVGTSPFNMYSTASKRTPTSKRQPLTASKRYGGKK